MVGNVRIPNRSAKSETNFVREHSDLLYTFWHGAGLMWNQETGDEHKIDGKKFYAGADVLAKMLLDNAKDLLSREQVYQLDENLEGYLSDDDFEKYANINK